MEVVRLGSTGPYVEYLQLALSRNGYYNGRIDGILGENTLNALKKFQTDFGLVADGVAGPATWARLMPYLRGYNTHTIKSGDTLWQLAKTYYTTIGAITTANPGLNPNNLTIGQVLVIPYGFAVIPTNVSYTSELVGILVDGLKKRYPFLRTGSIGKSVMGKDLYLITIGRGPTEVSYNASHHANEWITTPLLMKYMENYAKAYSINDKIFGVSANSLYNSTTLYMVPLVNPDGVDLVNGVVTGSYFDNAKALAANYPNIPFPSGWKANIVGVDLNLQYPAQWERAKEIKFAQGFTRPGPRDFVGSGPLTEPESLAVYNFTLNHNFMLILAYHTQGEVIYWKYADFVPPNSFAIAQRFGQVSGYSVETTPPESAYAGYKDWFIQNYNRPGYTIEAGLGVSPLPLSQFPKIYNDNVGILTLGMTLA